MPVPSNPQDLINIIREKLFNNTSGLIEEPDLREVLENIVKVLDAKFSMFSPNLTEEQFAKWNLILDYMAKETKGVLSPTSPAPTEKGKYLLSSAGTYANLGGLVAAADKLNYAYFDGTTWSLIAVDIGVGVVLDEQIKEMLLSESYMPQSATYTDGLINSPFNILWANGATGVMTVTRNTDGLVTNISATHIKNTITKTVTAVVTRNTDGNATNLTTSII